MIPTYPYRRGSSCTKSRSGPVIVSHRRLVFAASGSEEDDVRVASIGRQGTTCKGAPGLCVLAQPLAEGFAVENDLLARILQVSLSPELIHVVSDDFARRTYILR